jgi:cellulose synthase/poly-beta-1,6-N-acetylglucosamine synthase-like glycosyltransferase
MKPLFFCFVGLSILLWLTSFGYLAVLYLVSRVRRRAQAPIQEWPDIALVIPTCNEEEFISQKFANLEETDYPSDRLHLLVIDAGSEDRTTSYVQDKIRNGDNIQLVRLAGAKSKIEQVIHSLKLLKQKFIVFTDADSRLEPSCVKELVRLLLVDPQTAIVGATVKPESHLLEELIHWTLLNRVWWLEGEALSSAGFSGVCYAMRRESIRALDKEIKAEDIHLSLTACASGHRVRLGRSAVAHELRVPQTTRDFFRFRRRRGSRYVTALRHFDRQDSTPFSWRLVRGLRLWQFGVAPWLAMVFVVLALALLATPYWTCAVIASSVFLIPTLGGFPLLNREIGKVFGWGELILASARYLALLLISLLTLHRYPFSERERS